MEVRPSLFTCFLLFLLTSATTICAADRWWDAGTVNIGTPGNGASAGGNGTWNTTTLNWDQRLGLAHVTWNNANNDIANLGVSNSSATTILLGTDISAGGLTCDTSNSAYPYTLSGNRTLTLTGANPTINTTRSGGIKIGNSSSDTILAGTNGLIKNGPGFFTLQSKAAAHTLTGGIIINGGALVLDYTNTTAAANMLPTTNTLTMAGGTLTLARQIITANSQTFGDLTTDCGRSSLTFTELSTGSSRLTLGGLWSHINNGVLNIELTNGSLVSACRPVSRLDPIMPIGPWATTLTGATVQYAACRWPDNRIIPLAGGNYFASVGQASSLIAGIYNDLTNVGTNMTRVARDGLVCSAIRYTGISVGTISLAGTLTVNGLLNASGDIWSIGDPINPGTLIIGEGVGIPVGIDSASDLVVNAYTMGITINSTIVDNAAGPSSLTLVAPTVQSSAASPHILGTVNTYTGVTTLIGDGVATTSGLVNDTKTIIISALRDTGVNSEFGAGSSLVLCNAAIQTGTTGTSDRSITLNGSNGIFLKGAITQTLSGSITGTGNFRTDGEYDTLSNVPGGLGNLVLSGENDFTGEMLFAADSRITLNHVNALSMATLNMTGTRILADLTTHDLDYMIGGLKGSVAIDLGSGTVSIGNNNQSNSYTGVLSGAGSLTKTGTGTQILSAAHSYLGNTVVSAGTLLLKDTASLASPVIDVQTDATLDVANRTGGFTVAAAQTLGGTGTVVGTTTVAGTIAPGLAGIGTLRTGDVVISNISAAGTYACTLDGASCDVLQAASLTLTQATITFDIVNPPTETSYLIATYTGATPAHFATLNNLPPGYCLNYSTPGQIKLVVASTTEIAVEQPPGTDIAAGGSKDFGQVAVGLNNSFTFTIKNTGVEDLTNLTVTKDGAQASDFTITSSPVAPVSGPGGVTTFTVEFTPSAVGVRSAAIHIASNDADEDPFDIILSGTGVVVNASEIVVEQPVGTDIADGGSKDFGQALVGSTNSFTFTLKNMGDVDLTDLTVTKDGAQASDFTITSSPVAPVSGPGGTTTFTVQFTPSAAGVRSAAIHIASNDADENPFDITLSGIGVVMVGPEIAVEQPAGANIADGGSKDFGQVAVSSAKSLTFILKNTGNANLTGVTVTKDGAQSSDFTITSNPLAPVSGPSGVTTFTVQFSPSAAGVRNATLHIASNDADENPFDISLSGTGVAVTVPEIVVEQPVGTNIADGGSKDFGQVLVGSNHSLIFTIKNMGTVNLTGMTVTKDGTHASDFTITSGPLAPVGGVATFTVQFTPSAGGARNAAIHIVSNDADENPFDISLSGIGAVVATPDIVVEQPVGTNIADSDSKDFGLVPVGSSHSLTFTLKNMGAADLTGLAVTMDGAQASDFTITSSPDVPVIGPGGTSTFTVQFTPSAAGVHSTAIHIASNDGDENPFDIALSGTGVAVPEMVVEAPDGSGVADDGTDYDFGNVNLGAGGPARVFTIRNTGSANLTDITVNQDGSHSADFTVNTTGMAITLAPGTSTTFAVAFAPGGAGVRNAALHIASNDGDENPFDIALGGMGTALPEIAIEQSGGSELADSGGAIDFGSIINGVASPTQTLTIRNIGTADLIGIMVNKDGSQSSDFTVNTTGMATILAPGGSTTFSLTFTPGAMGARSAALHIASNDADENPFDVNLAGTGLSNDPFTICFVGTPFEPRIGNRITLDLKRLTHAGETIKLVGKLPAGLTFNASTGMISGTLSGKPGTSALSIWILQGKTVVRTVSFPITVQAFPSSLVGNFDCILEDTDSHPSGAFRLTITGANVWTATLESAGAAKRSTKGTFILGEGSPIAPIIAVFPAVSGAPAVTVNLAIDGTSPTLSGSYNGGSLRGFRLASGAELPPAIKTCNLVINAGPQDGITIPAGLGWLKGSWGKTGIGTFKGLLGDGTAATITLRLSATGQAVLWAQPYTNKNSYIGGIVTLDNLGQPTNDYAKLANGVWWSKAADAKSLSYPGGFPAMPVTLGAAIWRAPTSASSLGASLGWRNNRMAAVIIDGAGLDNQEPQTTTAALPTEFTLDDKLNLTVSAPATAPRVAWTGKAVRTNGSFTGTLMIPAGFSANIPVGAAAASGVFVQSEDWEGVTGCGLIKVPASGVKGSFRTAAFVLGQ